MVNVFQVGAMHMQHKLQSNVIPAGIICDLNSCLESSSKVGSINVSELPAAILCFAISAARGGGCSVMCESAMSVCRLIAASIQVASIDCISPGHNLWETASK